MSQLPVKVINDGERDPRWMGAQWCINKNLIEVGWRLRVETYLKGAQGASVHTASVRAPGSVRQRGVLWTPCF